MIGDGYDCVKPTCILGVCWCPDGYQYLNEKCERTTPSDENVPSKLFGCILVMLYDHILQLHIALKIEMVVVYLGL